MEDTFSSFASCIIPFLLLLFLLFLLLLLFRPLILRNSELFVTNVPTKVVSFFHYSQLCACDIRYWSGEQSRMVSIRSFDIKLVCAIRPSCKGFCYQNPSPPLSIALHGSWPIIFQDSFNNSLDGTNKLINSKSISQYK